MVKLKVLTQNRFKVNSSRSIAYVSNIATIKAVFNRSKILPPEVMLFKVIMIILIYLFSRGKNSRHIKVIKKIISQFNQVWALILEKIEDMDTLISCNNASPMMSKVLATRKTQFLFPHVSLPFSAY